MKLTRLFQITAIVLLGGAGIHALVPMEENKFGSIAGDVYCYSLRTEGDSFSYTIDTSTLATVTDTIQAPAWADVEVCLRILVSPKN